MFSCFLLSRLNVVMFMQVYGYNVYENRFVLLLKLRSLNFIYLVKLLSSRQVTLNPKNLDNTSNFENWNLTLVAYECGFQYLFIIDTGQLFTLRNTLVRFFIYLFDKVLLDQFIQFCKCSYFLFCRYICIPVDIRISGFLVSTGFQFVFIQPFDEYVKKV